MRFFDDPAMHFKDPTGTIRCPLMNTRTARRQPIPSRRTTSELQMSQQSESASEHLSHIPSAQSSALIWWTTDPHGIQWYYTMTSPTIHMPTSIGSQWKNPACSRCPHCPLCLLECRRLSRGRGLVPHGQDPICRRSPVVSADHLECLRTRCWDHGQLAACQRAYCWDHGQLA